MSTRKKVHIGQHGKPKCVTVWSLHVRHRPSLVAPLEEFKNLPMERRCQKCQRFIEDKDGVAPTHEPQQESRDA